ncbi:GyrI-like domain-containing protein [Streptomyces marianii]|uniref:GyrI-like domain-containing protein n=1 Tax=Streptomyces marianii TaxID=1817406 RepID=A0A5R9E330_9ACTN|nr:GyrI-like domain-containing protein [Streptomyces marianii]TLQ44320.1 GyrI-like domain-containing protein [Streptomyces marianii]
MDTGWDVETGAPVVSATARGHIAVGSLPAGRYGALDTHGHPDGLFDAVTRLREWATEQGLERETTAVRVRSRST